MLKRQSKELPDASISGLAACPLPLNWQKKRRPAWRSTTPAEAPHEAKTVSPSKISAKTKIPRYRKSLLRWHAVIHSGLIVLPKNIAEELKSASTGHESG